MKKTGVLVVFAVVSLCLTGCFEVDQDYTLNPDGSGKVLHRVKQPDILGQGEAGLKQVLEKQLSEAKGVDAWSDVSVEISEDGSFLFTGTAYFSDLNELVLEDADAFRFRWEPSASGAYALTLDTSGGESEEFALSSDDIAAAVKKARQEWNQVKPMMQGMLGSFKWQASFHLPASVVDVSGLEETASDRVSFAMTGARYFEAVDEMMSDDAFLEAQARRGGFEAVADGDEQMPPEIMAKLFGEDGVYALTASKATPLFDYAAAVSAAESNFEAMMASLPVEAPKQIVPPARGGDFRTLKVIGTGYVTDSEQAWQKAGAKLSVVGVLPGSVIKADEGRLVAATSADGSDLMPEDEWDRRFSVSLDSEDPTRVQFEVSTALPPAGAKGFRNVSGVVYYVVASEPDEEIELFSRLQPGTPGEMYPAVLGEIEPGYSEGTEQVTIDIGLPMDEISELVFSDADGRPLDVQHISTSWSDDSTSLSYMSDGAFPRDGKVRLKVRKGLKTYEVPFTIANIDLTGRPMK